METSLDPGQQSVAFEFIQSFVAFRLVYEIDSLDRQQLVRVQYQTRTDMYRRPKKINTNSLFIQDNVASLINLRGFVILAKDCLFRHSNSLNNLKTSFIEGIAAGLYGDEPLPIGYSPNWMIKRLKGKLLLVIPNYLS